MGKETIRVSFPVPQSGVQASPLLQRLRGLLPASHQVLQLRLAALLFHRQASACSSCAASSSFAAISRSSLRTSFSSSLLPETGLACFSFFGWAGR